MAKTLKASVDFDISKAERKLNQLTKKVNNLQKAINKTTVNNNQVETAIRRKVTAEAGHLKTVNQVNKSYSKQKTLVDGIHTKLKRLAGTYLGIMGGKAIVTASDTITSAENKLNQLNNGNTAATQQQLDKMYASSQKVRMGYADMMSNVAKSMTLAGSAFGGNMDTAIRFQEIMGEAYAVGGASAAEQHSSMYQMIQGLGSGILQGDELRSVREGAPLAYKAIEEFAQGIYGAEENLKDLASQGKITSDIVVAAIMAAGEDMDKAFTKTDMTFAQAWINIKNTALKAFEPVLQKLNDLLNSPVGQSLISGIGTAIQVVANLFLWLFGIVESIYNFFVTHWPIISKILLTIGAIIAIALIPKLVSWVVWLSFVVMYYGYVAATAIASAITTATAWIMANLPLFITLAVLAAIVIALIWVADSFVDACGIIGGVVWVVLSFIGNLIQSLFNFIMGVIAVVVTAIANALGAISNCWYDGIVVFWEWVKELLDGTGIVAKALNSIASLFGLDTVSIDAKISDAKSKHFERTSYADAWAAGSSTFGTGLSDWSAGKAYEDGYAVGAAGGSWITDKVSGLLGSLTGAGGIATNYGSPAYALGGGYDPSNALDSIDGNTGKMADSMELAEEDLKFLKDVAHMEWKKEFTTASIKVDMSNYNSINGDSDLDGIVTKLTDKLYEELNAVADGVYSY